MGYTSDIVECVKAFLVQQHSDIKNAPRDLNDVKKIAQRLGYGEPFDREQRAINQLLCQAKASVRASSPKLFSTAAAIKSA